MIDVSSKFKTLRIAYAEANILLKPETITRIREKRVEKGDPIEVGKTAGIMGAKKTSEFIPFCHPIPVDWISFSFKIQEDSIKISCEVKSIARTGVEMEALTGVTVCALTIYDMLKHYDSSIEIQNVKLIKKEGGKSDFKEILKEPLKVAVYVLSDSVYQGKKEDTAGLGILGRLADYDVEIKGYKILPDDAEVIKGELIKSCDTDQVDLILTSGGTGLSPRDVTADVTKNIIEKDIAGLAEAQRIFGFERTPYAMLSRQVAGIRGRTVIINLPGSKKGVLESMDALFPWIFHLFKVLKGFRHD